MHLKVLDQLHVSAVSSETLRVGQVIEVHASLGEELLERHPDKFKTVSVPKAKKKAEAENKAAPEADNKSAG